MSIELTADASPADDEARDLSPRPLPGPFPAVAVAAALGARRLLQRLAEAVVPAQVTLFEMATGVSRTQALGVAARHRIADLLSEGPRAADELARRAGLDADALHRLLRFLASRGVFRLRSDGRFENNRLSRALRSEDLGRGRHWCEYMGSRATSAAWAGLDDSVRTGRSAFPKVHGMSVWEWFDAHPEEREAFAQGMMGLTVAEAPVIATLYPFGEVRRLCDVGGGRGTLLSEILVRHRHLRGVLYDAPGVVASARPLLQRRGVADRVEAAAGSFFDAVPGGCDAYLLKNILHDWDDESCLRILRNCRRAMEPGARVIIAEMLVERNDAGAIGPAADLQMLVVCDDGRERGRGELQQLLRDAGFRPGRVFPYPVTSIIEGVAA